MWKSLRKRYFKKCNHASAMMDADADSRERWLQMLAKQKASAIIMQTCIRAWYARVTYRKRKFAWNASATMLQRTWRKVLEKRSHTDEYKERRAALKIKAIAAQNLLIPWVNLYPDEVLNDVGELLKKDPSKVGYYEIAQLEKAEVKWAEYHLVFLASKEVQRVFRGFLGKRESSKKFIERVEKQHRRQYKSAIHIQKRFRAHRARRWRVVFDLQQQTRRLVKRLPVKLDAKYGVRKIIKKHYKHVNIMGANVEARKADARVGSTAVKKVVIRELRGPDLWKGEIDVLRDALRWGRKHLIETASANLFQKIFRGHQGKLAYLAKLAAFNKDATDALHYKCARSIQTRWRGVHSRRTRDAKDVIARVWALDHARYPQILTRKIRSVVNTRPESISFVQITRLHAMADEWILYRKMDMAALRVQRRYRGLKGRYSYMLLLAARKEAEHDRAVWAAKLVQRNFRGRLHRMSFLKLVQVAKNEKLRKQYLEERRASIEQEKFELQLKHEEKRQRVLQLHKQRLQQQKLKIDLAWKRQQAKFAKEMLQATKEDQAYLHDIRILNAWRQFAEHDGRVYYYNEVTGESTFNPPAHWKYPSDEPNKLLYWKNLDEVKIVGTQTISAEEENICQHCHTRTARRECNECVSRFCVPCYTAYHQEPERHNHTFKIVDPLTERVLRCVECEYELARVRCKQCEDVYCFACYQDVHSRGQRTKHTYDEFVEGAKICVECDKDFAVKSCQQCGDVFCASCADKTHAKGKMRDHTMTDIDPYVADKLKRGQEYCSECDRRVAVRVCDQCLDCFCGPCYDAVHSKGKRAKHTYTAYEKTGRASGWEEYWDDEKQKYVYFNKITKESRSAKPIELMGINERAAFVRQQREEMQKAKMEEEIQKLKEQVKIASEEKTIAEKKANKLQETLDQRDRVRANIRDGMKKARRAFVFGQRKKDLELFEEEEFLKKTVLDKNYTADKYKGDLLNELEEDRIVERKQAHEKAIAEKKKMKKQELRGMFDDSDDDDFDDDFID
eukprot:g252.t1